MEETEITHSEPTKFKTFLETEEKFWFKKASQRNILTFHVSLSETDFDNFQFFNFPFSISNQVLIPRKCTETLVSQAISFLNNKSPEETPIHVLDLGTGSGCIILSLLLVIQLT